MTEEEAKLSTLEEMRIAIQSLKNNKARRGYNTNRNIKT